MIENCSVTDNLMSNSVRDQHRDLFVEILKDTGKHQSVNDRMLQEILSLRQERDKAHQYWQIAEGRCDALQERIDSLLTTGNAVVERWDSPLWKDLPHTGESIHALREAIAKAKGQS